MSAVEQVEQAAIAAAHEYAVANGYDREDRTAAGLVLAGMAIGASLPVGANRDLLRGYLRAHPGAALAIDGWARSIAAAGRLP